MAEKIDELYWVLDARTGAFVSKMGQSEKSLKKFTAAIKGPGGAAAALALIGVTATLAAIKATKAAAELDKAFREVVTLLPGAVDEYENLRQAIIDLSTRVPAPPEQLSKGLYQVISAGITDTADAMYVLETATKAATAGLTDTFTSVDAITTVLNAYQLEASEAARVSDIFFATVREGKLRFEDIAANIGNVATSAALAGVSIEELGAAMATMTKFGVSAGESATALNRFILSLTMATTDQVQAAKDLGIEFNLTALRSKGLIGFLQEMADATQGNLELLAAINPNIRAARAAFILAGEGIGEYTRILKETQNAAGAAGQAFGKMEGSLQEQWALLKNKVNRVWLNLGNEILPGVIQALEGLNAVLSSETERQIELLHRLGLEEEALNLERQHMVQQRGEQIEEESRDLDRLLEKYEEAGRRAAFSSMSAFMPGVRARGAAGEFKNLQGAFDQTEIDALLPRLEGYNPTDFMLSGTGAADEVREALEAAIEYGEQLVRTRDLTDEVKISVGKLVREHRQALAILDRIKDSQQTITDLTAPDPELSRLEQRIAILKRGGPALAEEVAQLEAIREEKLLDLEISETRLELQLALNEAYVAGAQVFAATSASMGAGLEAMSPVERMAALEKTITQSQERRAELTQQAATYRAAAVGLSRQEAFAQTVMARQAESSAEAFERTEQTAKILLAQEKARAALGREVTTNAQGTSSALEDQQEILSQIAQHTAELTQAGAMSALAEVMALRDAAVAAFGELPEEVERDLDRLQGIAERALDAALYERFATEVRENITRTIRDARLAAYADGAEDSGIATVGLIAGEEILTLERERVRLALEELGVSEENEASRERLLDLLQWIEDQLRSNIRTQERAVSTAEREEEARARAAQQASREQREAEREAQRRFQEQQTILSLVRQGVTGALDLAEAFGTVDEEIANIIQSLTDAVVGAKTLIDSIKLTQELAAAGASTLPGIAGIVSGGLGMLGGFASAMNAPNPDAERARRMEQENTDALRRLTDSVDNLREFMFSVPGDISAAIDQAFAAAETFTAAQTEAGRISTASMEAEVFMRELDRQGVTITDLEDLAARANINIDEFLEAWQSLQNTGNLGIENMAEGHEVAVAWRDIQEAFSQGLSDFFDSVEGRLEKARREIELFDLDEPVQQISKLVDVLVDSGVQLSRREIERLRAGDETVIQELVAEIESQTGRFAPGVGGAGEFNAQDLIDLLVDLEKLGDAADEASGGSTSFQTVSRITMEQANLIIAALSTQTFYLRNIAESTAALAGGREIDVPLPEQPEPAPTYIPDIEPPEVTPPSPESPGESGIDLPWEEYFPPQPAPDFAATLEELLPGMEPEPIADEQVSATELLSAIQDLQAEQVAPVEVTLSDLGLTHLIDTLATIRVTPEEAMKSFEAMLAGTISQGLRAPTEEDMQRFVQSQPDSGTTTLVFEPGAIAVQVDSPEDAGPVLAEEVNRVLGDLFEQNRRGVGLPTVRY